MLKHLFSILSLSVLVPFGLGACSSGGGGSSSTTYKYAMSGSYSFPNISVSSVKVGTMAATGTFTLKWNEAAQAITGTYTDSNGLTGPVTGTIQGTTREILVTFSTLVGGTVKSLLFSADESAISNGNLTNATVVARNESGGVVDTGTYTASVEFPDDGDHGGGSSITCTGDPSGDMASWGFMKGCRYYKVIQSVSNYNCPYYVNTPVNIGVNGDGTAKVLINDEIVFSGSIWAAQSASTVGRFVDPDPSATTDSKQLSLTFASEVPTTGSMQIVANSNVTVQCMLEYVEDL